MPPKVRSWGSWWIDQGPQGHGVPAIPVQQEIIYAIVQGLLCSLFSQMRNVIEVILFSIHYFI